MVAPAMHDDRNFNDLSERFTRSIYGTPRGRLRLAALSRDFAECGIELAGKRVLDVGGGQGQFSLQLARQGAAISLCDISAEMVDTARQAFDQAGYPIHARVSPLQNLESDFPGRYHIVMNHAVLEWLERPFEAIPLLCQKVAPEGWLSLMFYNLHGHQWRQLMNGRLHAPGEANRRLKSEGNAPKHPLDPEEVMAALIRQNFEIVRWRGIRCVRDHLPGKIRTRLSEAAIADADLEFGLRDPYRQLGRYIHVLAKRSYSK